MSPLARYRQLSPTASVMVSPICLGTMTFGEANSERYGKCDKATSFEITGCVRREGWECSGYRQRVSFYQGGGVVSHTSASLEYLHVVYIEGTATAKGKNG
jgi:hypothetical protein